MSFEPAAVSLEPEPCSYYLEPACISRTAGIVPLDNTEECRRCGWHPADHPARAFAVASYGLPCSFFWKEPGTDRCEYCWWPRSEHSHDSVLKSEVFIELDQDRAAVVERQKTIDIGHEERKKKLLEAARTSRRDRAKKPKLRRRD